MCDVCIAGAVLAAQDDPLKFRAGVELRWLRSKNTSLVFVRAKGTEAEFKPAEYQFRRPGEKWPRKWHKTADLAGVMAFYGFDVKWKYVKKSVKDWLTKGAKMPEYVR